MTKTTRAPRIAEIAADEGYNLAGAPVLLAKLTAYVGRATFAQLAAIAQACAGEYSKHNTAFQFTDPAARESFAAQARVILSNPAPAAYRAATAQALDNAADIASQEALQSRRRADRADDPAALAAEGRAESADYAARVYRAQAYTDAPTQETPPAIRVSVSRPIGSTITDRTPAGYGPAQPALF